MLIADSQPVTLNQNSTDILQYTCRYDWSVHYIPACISAAALSDFTSQETF